MDPKVQCRFFILRYAPDAIKNEFINVGLVLLGDAVYVAWVRIGSVRVVKLDRVMLVVLVWLWIDMLLV